MGVGLEVVGEKADQGRHGKGIPGIGTARTKAWRWGMRGVCSPAQLEQSSGGK